MVFCTTLRRSASQIISVRLFRQIYQRRLMKVFHRNGDWDFPVGINGGDTDNDSVFLFCNLYRCHHRITRYMQETIRQRQAAGMGCVRRVGKIAVDKCIACRL